MNTATLLTRLQDATKAFSEQNGYAKATNATKLSKKARTIGALIDSSEFGCNRETVAALTSLIIDEAIPVTRKPGDFTSVHLAVVVPLTNTNSHDYPIGKPCILLHRSWGGAFRIDGKRGNSLPCSKDALRPARPEEINQIAAVLEANIDALLT